MTERPILFSGPMVRAILSGSKSQTRRVVKPNRRFDVWPISYHSEHVNYFKSKCPYGQPGGRLWVRETWSAPHAYDHLPPRLIPQDARIHYTATEDRGGLLWRPSIHMPRWASRITLEVEAVRVERLQDISEADAEAEGIEWQSWHQTSDGMGEPYEEASDAFRALWESINGPGSWDRNDWVWVITFRRITP